MSKMWNAFSGKEYLFGANGPPIGSYEETSALLACSIIRQRGSSRRPEKDEPGADGRRRSRRRLVSARDMGSNVSRHSGKGLSGRRAQSSGSLCKILAPRVGRVFYPCGESGEGVRRRDRNKLSGSLPNKLDEKDTATSNGSTPDSVYEELYRSAKKRSVELFLQKILPQHDPGGSGDQGYDSERSPEDEAPAKTIKRRSVVRRSSQVSFITKENTFEAKLEKGSRGLGLSVTGGVDADDEYPGLVRIKRIFPHQPAWDCGLLEPGHILLEANGTPLTGLTNHEALEVLRTTPNEVVLKVCRPPPDVFPAILPQGTGVPPPPPPPKRDPFAQRQSQGSNSSSQCTSSLLPCPQDAYGDFEVILKKVNGSLGFTLRKEDESVLGHYVRALVREPAISDGRIRPGDKIVSVNGADISSMTHEEAVAFLRQCGEEVKLRLYRDPAQTPVSALSPTESHKAFRPKPVLRKEAVDMLCDLAVRKLTPTESSSSSSARSRLKSGSPSASPRRRRLAAKTSAELDEEPASMPPIPTVEFSHKNPLYQSALPAVHADDSGSQGLLKWKGVVFTAGDNVAEDAINKDQVLTVELCRGWNSRLGFSLQSSDSATFISAIYPDSVAAKDGRLQSGDQVIMINDEPTKNMSTSDVIDLLRRVRGTIAITVVRSS